MRGKWEKERERKPWIWIVVLAVVVILGALFFSRDLWRQDKDQLPVKETMPADETEITEATEGLTEPTETETTQTELPATEPEQSDEEAVVINAYVNEDNHLIFVYSNGKEIDTGSVDTSSEDETSKDTSSEDTSSNDTLSKDTSSEDTPPNDTSSEDTQEQFKVVFMDYSGTVLKEELVNNGGSATPPTVPVWQGYVFVGWDGSYTDISADVSLTALYVPSTEDTVTYTVRFVDYDDVLLKKETVMKGTAATAPGNPLRNGYVFTGWDKPFDKVTSDLTVKAQYEAYTGPEIVIEEVKAAAGSEEVAVTLRVQNNPGIASLKFLVAYDEALTLTKVVYNPELGGHSMMPQTMDSPIVLNWVSPFEDKTGDWVFATLYFTVADNAKGSLPITATYDPNDVFDLTETNIQFRVSNGAIIVP